MMKFNVTARIANFRKVEWESLSINFVMVFSPNTFRGAPHAWLATLGDPGATPQKEAAILKSVTNAYPTITSVRVKDALEIIAWIAAHFFSQTGEMSRKTSGFHSICSV